MSVFGLRKRWICFSCDEPVDAVACIASDGMDVPGVELCEKCLREALAMIEHER